MKCKNCNREMTSPKVTIVILGKLTSSFCSVQCLQDYQKPRTVVFTLCMN